MKLPVFAVLLVAASGADPELYIVHWEPPLDVNISSKAASPTWGTIVQKLDHKNPSDTRTWKMRYLSNGQFFRPGGPIFIFLGGEWTIAPNTLMSGQIFDLAEEHKGYMFYTEHRYYGESYPTQDYSTENLRYLSVEQALEDVAYFIKYQKANIAELANSKVVVIGGSYSATMATWMRLKYPQLVDVAYASSAPLRAVKDFYQYHEVVDRSIGSNSPQCLATIKQGIEQTEQLMRTAAGLARVNQLYNTCSPVTNEQPYRAFFFFNIGGVFAGLVQNSEVGQILNECNRLLSYQGSSLDKLAQYVRSTNRNCLPSYDQFVQYVGNTALTTSMVRQWIYQTCTQFGFFQTTTSQKQPFGNTFPLQLYLRFCLDLYNGLPTEKVIDDAVDKTNSNYGSLNPPVSKLVSVHGTIDPWHALGLTHDLSEDVVTIVVKGTAHCKDLHSVSHQDIEELRQAKLKARALIGKWLRE